MKKVRYAIGALGAAPTMALMMPTANAATVAPAAHTEKTGKSVSLNHSTLGKTAQSNVICGFSKRATAVSTRGEFNGRVQYQGSGCVASVFGVLNHHQTGLSMRTRLYSINGTRVYQNYVKGEELSDGTTHWSTSPNHHAHQACEALVLNGTNTVEYGPICETL